MTESEITFALRCRFLDSATGYIFETEVFPPGWYTRGGVIWVRHATAQAMADVVSHYGRCGSDIAWMIVEEGL